MDEKILSSIMNAASSKCWSIENYNPIPGVLQKLPASNNYDGGFACELMLKDLRLAVDASKEAKSTVNLGGNAK